MPITTVSQVAIRGISACVPQKIVSNRDYDHLSEQERKLLIKTTGIEERRFAAEGVTTSDLCVQAATVLLKELAWHPEEVEVLIFVSQSRDYFLPATATVLQHRLGLSKETMSFDIGLGCSGYVYGLSVVSHLLAQGGYRRALLMAGDISTYAMTYRDKSVYPLFGDAATVTALEYDPTSANMYFYLQSDGKGKDAIIIPDGGLRHPLTDESYIEREVENGLFRSRRGLWLDGAAVFSFSITEVAPNLRKLMNASGSCIEDYDYFILHQANFLMNETIRKQLKIPVEKVPYSLQKFGNTSSASIPLTLVTQLSQNLTTTRLRLGLAGFGVGLSWASADITTENIVCPPLVEWG